MLPYMYICVGSGSVQTFKGIQIVEQSQKPALCIDCTEAAVRFGGIPQASACLERFSKAISMWKATYQNVKSTLSASNKYKSSESTINWTPLFLAGA